MSDPDTVGCTFECKASSVDWAVLGAAIAEDLNRPYQISLELVTDGAHHHADEMLGESCTVTIARGGKTSAYPAIVRSVSDTATGDMETTVSVQAVAALALLGENRQTRVFQGDSVPDILDKVLKEGLKPYQREHKSDLKGDYPKCEYRVQYDESDFDFCSRLMEEEGIAYTFDRSDSAAEVLLLTDDPKASAGDAQPAKFAGEDVTHERVADITRASTLRPTKVAMRHFNWTSPSVPIEEEKEGDGTPAREVYYHDRLPPTLHDYSPGDGYKKNNAKTQCQVRRELDAVGELVLEGSGNVIAFAAGACFKLQEHELEGEYLLTSVDQSFSARGFTNYTNRFTCIPADTPYRPVRQTPMPRVAGIETATVVGPSNQEIHTDKHGRIKVQFHWDRLGENDDHSSCFIRVVQPWAGAGWGFVFLPRIGMEVTVAFVHGDPDRPIITGTVYNGENLTPYDMPGEMTKSTIRTKSSPDSDGYNELTFEDKAGEEEVFLQAEKNLRELVKNDHGTKIQNDQTLEVENDQSTTIGNDQTLDVVNDQKTTVGNDQTLDVAANQTITVEGDKKEDVTGNFDQTVLEGDFTQTITEGSTVEDVKKNRTCTVGEEWSTEAKKNVTLKSADENVEIASGKKMDLKAGDNFTLKGDKKGTIELTDELKIKVGQASITMTSSGDIKIEGVNIKISGNGEVTIKGSKTAIN